MKSNTDLEDIDNLDSTEEFKLYLRFPKHIVRRLDKYNIVVEEIKVTTKGENIGAEYTTNIGYYKRLEHALEKVLRLSIENSKLTELKDVIEAIKLAKEELYTVLENKYKDIEDK